MYNDIRRKSFEVLSNGRMNVSRQVEVPDAQTGGQTFELEQVLTDIPCHITISSHDNPNPTTVGIMPIIQTIKIRFDKDVKLQISDAVECKKFDVDTVLCSYTGIIGQPDYNGVRGTAYLLMNRGG